MQDPLPQHAGSSKRPLSETDQLPPGFFDGQTSSQEQQNPHAKQARRQDPSSLASESRRADTGDDADKEEEERRGGALPEGFFDTSVKPMGKDAKRKVPAEKKHNSAEQAGATTMQAEPPPQEAEPVVEDEFEKYTLSRVG